MLFFLFLLLLSSFSSCKKKKKVFHGNMKIYILCPFTTIHGDRKPVHVIKFLIIEGNIKDLAKAKDTVMMYINSNKNTLICKNDTVTHFSVYQADFKFDHFYKQTRPNSLDNYEKNRVLWLSYEGDILYNYDYIIQDGSKFPKLSKTPPVSVE